MFDAMDLYTPYESASGTRTHVRVSAGTRGVCVRRRNEEAPVWRGVGEDDGEKVEKDEGEEEREEGGRGRNTSGEPLWKEDMMARGVMLRELLCSSGTTGP